MAVVMTYGFCVAIILCFMHFVDSIIALPYGSYVDDPVSPMVYAMFQGVNVSVLVGSSYVFYGSYLWFLCLWPLLYGFP
jgi:hypothetical protein